jgi:hypothetical protein
MSEAEGGRKLLCEDFVCEGAAPLLGARSRLKS